MFNKAILMGRICHDLELKTTPSGFSVLSFRIAVDRNYQVKGEERKADFFSVVAWRGTAEFVSKYFGKGRMIMVDGELQTRQYQDKNTNATVNVVEIVASSVHFTGEKKDDSGGQGGGYGGGGGYNAPPQGNYGNPSAPQPPPAYTGAYGNPPPSSPSVPTPTPQENYGYDEDDYPF
jgi:single-strand DNA-binding protein